MTDTTTDTSTETSTDTTDTGTDTAAELAKWQALARKHEERAKANSAAAKELDTFKQQSMTETEKAVNAARLEGESAGAKKASERLARAEIRAALAGRNVDVDALLEGVDATRFLDDEGEPDLPAIKAWSDKVAPAEQEDKPKPTRDLGQGVRGAGPNAALNGDPLLRDIKSKLGL